jgi:hypothetical protein
VARFIEIFDIQTLDHEYERIALTKMAEAAGWMVLHPGESVRFDDGRSIVISGVTWSKPDLEVLDELASRDTGDAPVWFFNPDYVFPDDRILPGTPRMLATPALAEYSGTRLVSFAQGRGVMDQIRKLFPLLSNRVTGTTKL